jgi:acyl-coenzyme A thioesterase PaaI-like protein
MTSMLEQGQQMLRGQLTPPPIARLLGFTLKSIEPGHAVFEMEVDEHHHNPMGTLMAASTATWLMRRWGTPTPPLWGRARRSQPSS